MFQIALRDLQFRRRRFLISVAAVALVLAMTLLLSGLSNAFGAETARTLDDLGADAWITPEQADGPFLGASPMLEADAEQVAAAVGADDAAPVGFRALKITVGGGAPQPANGFGVVPGRLGAPVPDAGRPLASPGEVVVGDRAGAGVGEEVVVGTETFEVVGVVSGSSALAGAPNAFFALGDLQRLAFAGQPIVSTVAVTGAVEVPAGHRVFDRAGAADDLLAPMADASDTIATMSILLWVVAAAIIASVIYLSALERVGDFAVFKAIGMSSGWVFGGLVVQALVLAVAASAVAMVLALPLRPTLPMPSEIPTAAFVGLPLTATVVAAIASLAGVRKALTVDPALAFG